MFLSNNVVEPSYFSTTIVQVMKLPPYHGAISAGSATCVTWTDPLYFRQVDRGAVSTLL
jgi:hypothetical protein